jgi:hypothetical protein
MSSSSSKVPSLPTTIPSTTNVKRTGRGSTLKTVQEPLSIDEQLEQMTQDLEEANLSEVKRYALKKQIKVLQAKKNREERAQQQQQNVNYF